MLITGLKKIDDKRFCLYLDYEPFCSVYSSDIKRLKLVEDGDIAEEKIMQFRKDYLYKRAMNKAISSLKCSEKCEQDIRNKLSELYYDEEIISHTLSKLLEYSYVDDVRFSRNYMRRYLSKKNIKSITYELSRKGVSEDSIEMALTEIELPEEYDTVYSIISKKYTKERLINKGNTAIMSLMQKGFSLSVIKKVINDIIEE